MKKIVSLILATAALCASGALFGCSSGEATVNYTLSEDGTYYILSSVSNKRALQEYDVPATYTPSGGGEALPVKVIATDAFCMCTKLMKVTIPDSVTEIGVRAFGGCPFTQITIPDSVETIGNAAFMSCTNLESVVIPQSVTELGYKAFYGCSGLKRAEVYANVTDLKGGVFYNKIMTNGGETYTFTSLTEVVISSNVKKIADSALYGNIIEDIYFTGTEEQWDELYFYTYQLKEGKDDEYEEVKKEKSDYLPSTTTVHFEYSPKAE